MRIIQQGSAELSSPPPDHDFSAVVSAADIMSSWCLRFSHVDDGKDGDRWCC